MRTHGTHARSSKQPVESAEGKEGVAWQCRGPAEDSTGATCERALATEWSIATLMGKRTEHMGLRTVAAPKPFAGNARVEAIRAGRPSSTTPGATPSRQTPRRWRSSSVAASRRWLGRPRQGAPPIRRPRRRPARTASTAPACAPCCEYRRQLGGRRSVCHAKWRGTF